MSRRIVWVVTPNSAASSSTLTYDSRRVFSTIRCWRRREALIGVTFI
ncbi:hypothetical protein [Pararhodobacter sp. SW119]|nr:hypothetical protein [Pararhodobacter sp. SW119]